MAVQQQQRRTAAAHARAQAACWPGHIDRLKTFK
jgi:hypothetical protein